MSKLYVQLAKTGDILALLPLLYADFQLTGERSKLMVAKEFASVLDSCSYVEPVVFDGDYMDLDRAVAEAQAIGGDIIVTSIHGTNEALERHTYSQVYSKGRVTSSFQKEAWNLAHRLGDWDSNLPLVFDRRSPEREKQLLDANGFSVKGKRKPVILLALGGVTSPFPFAHLLREFVTSKFKASHRVIDLPMVAADGRVYDLLAVMERSALLITTDSMPLHLAWACRSLPVFALTNDRDAQGNHSLWHGSPWRPNHLWYCRYHDWPARAVEMAEAINHMEPESRGEFVTVFRSDSVDNRCTDIYRGSWNLIPVHRGTCSRELNGAPFVKDVIRMAIQRATPFMEQSGDGDCDSKINLCRENVTAKVKTSSEPHFAYRLHKGQHEPIVDLFSAPKSFWKTILPEIPDLLLDNDEIGWSQALWAIFRKHGAVDSSGCCEFVGGEK